MKHLFFIAIIFHCTYSFGQVITASVENQSKYYLKHVRKLNTKEKQEYQAGENIIQIETTGFKFQVAYTVRFNGIKHGITIHRLDSSHTEIAVNELAGGEKEFGPLRSVSTEFGDELLLFYFKYVDKDSMKLYMSEIDKNSLQLINTTYLFGYQQDNVGLFKLAKAMSREAKLFLSPDKSKLMVALQAKKDDFFTCVFDKNLQVLRKNTSKLSGSEDLMLDDAFLDNSGNSIIALSKEHVSDETFGGTIEEKFFLQNANGNEKLMDIKSWYSDVELRDVRFESSKDQSKIFAFGEYKGAVANGGIWISEIQIDKLSLAIPKTFPYPDEFKKQVYDIGFADKKKDNYGILDAELQLSEFENGDLVIGGSPLLRHDGTYTDSKGGRGGYVTYFAGPVMMMFLNDKKEPSFGMLPRYQWHCGGSKSIFIPYKNKLVVVYNDVEKNINEQPNTEEVRMKGINMAKELSLASAIVNKSGKVETKQLLAGGISRLTFFNTSSCDFISDMNLRIPAVATDKNGERLAAIITVK